MQSKLRKIAASRLKRDFIELQRSEILSIAAHPIDKNIFEWHVNIKPTDGVYSGVYFHLIMLFPDNYPSHPPQVKICTPICHPNILGSFLCLSMLRPYTTNVPYEGWSAAYSVTSILMQLQSFLFAEKIDQDGGYQVNARLSDQEVKHSISVCQGFECKECKHSHSSPWPKVKGPPESLIKVFPTDPDSKHVVVQGSACQTTHTNWVGAYGEFGCNFGKIMYEVFINWTGDKWAQNNIRGGLCRFGFGSEYASVCGRDMESFGYGGTGMFSYNDSFNKYGESFTKDDTITCAVDFDTKRIFFAKNGIMMEPMRELYIPQYLHGVLLFPILSFKNSRAEFNFGQPKKPCKWLIHHGFRTLEQVATEQGVKDGEADLDEDDMKLNDDNNNNNNDDKDAVNWHSEYIVDQLWLNIFLALMVQEVFGAKFVCKKWNGIIDKYNIMERNEIYCYFTKFQLGQTKDGKILGIGLNIIPSEKGTASVHSQMDVLSLNAWKDGCRIGVWGETLTHFLPLVMNREHSELADSEIKRHLQIISSIVYVKRSDTNTLERCITENPCLQLIDTLITMMNQIVVQFVTSNENTEATTVSMIMCEKVVLGYCALHHLLLYLTTQNKKVVTDFANKTIWMFLNKDDGSNKTQCRDLGKLLIYLMICTKYEWKDIAKLFVEEVFTRNVRWMVYDAKYKHYDTTEMVPKRLTAAFHATKISRRLVMFQVWFMKKNASQTLQGYNERLGRPRVSVRNGIQSKTKFILNSKSWMDYFNELNINIRNEKAVGQLLQFAVYNSLKKRYHTHFNQKLVIKKVNPPQIRVNNQYGNNMSGTMDENDDNMDDFEGSASNSSKIALNSGRGRGWNARGSGWRGRGRGGSAVFNARRPAPHIHNNGNGQIMPNNPPFNTQQNRVHQPNRGYISQRSQQQQSMQSVSSPSNQTAPSQQQQQQQQQQQSGFINTQRMNGNLHYVYASSLNNDQAQQPGSNQPINAQLEHIQNVQALPQRQKRHEPDSHVNEPGQSQQSRSAKRRKRRSTGNNNNNSNTNSNQ